MTLHEDKRHIYQEGDYVVLREVEGMTQINETKPIKIMSTTVFTLTLDIDSTSFSDYERQGSIENVKVPKTVSFHNWATSFRNPVGSTAFGMLETPDLAKFGRSDQLHAAFIGIHAFVTANNRYPTSEDAKACLEMANSAMKVNQAANDQNMHIEIEEDVFNKAVSWAGCSISPMSAFFGGIMA